MTKNINLRTLPASASPHRSGGFFCTIMYDFLYNTKICITFALMFLSFHFEQDLEELVEVLRNIRRSYPDGYEQQALYAQMLFEKLLDFPGDEDEEQ